jgi:crotonobetainyl-CoA:carnitine CoA-transferase CaiB-like acyl-CoA transferase
MPPNLTGSLAGIKVIDISRVLAGPSCTQILADHGAEVIKVEPPVGDDTRKWGPPFKDGAASYYMGVNRNKRAIVLDLSVPAGREVLLDMLADADVLVENFKTGTMERWGLDFEEVLSKRFPRLVHCRITGFGADGPLGGLPGYDAVVQAMSGLMSINGDPDGGATRIGVPVVDMATGLNATVGIAMALFERSRSGRGQFIETALYDVAISLLHPQGANWFMSGKPQRLLGNGHPNIVPYDKFPTRTVDIFIGVGNDGQFRALAKALDLDDVAADPRFATNAARGANRPELRERLVKALAAHDGEALCEQLARAGVPAGPVRDVGSALSHPHTLHREMAVELEGYRGTGVPVKMSRTPGSVRTPPPRYGEHNRELLAELGYSEERIASLIEQHIVVEKQ